MLVYGRRVFVSVFCVYVRAVLVFGSAEVVDTGNYTCVADQATQTVLFIVTPGQPLLIVIIIIFIMVIGDILFCVLEYFFLGNKTQMLKDLSGHSPLVNLFFKTITKKITVVQYQNEKRRRETKNPE